MLVNKIKNRDVFFQAPASKAHTLRALVLSALANGKSVITNPLLGQDQLHLIGCLKNLGVEITQKDNQLFVTGNSGHFSPITENLNCGESGVSMNVLTALTSLVEGKTTITGADGLLLRPIGEVVKGIRQLGANVDFIDKIDFPPISIQGKTLLGGVSEISGSKTSQYFSALAMTAPYAENETTLICSDEMSEKPYFDITQEMMSHFGVDIINRNYKQIDIKPQKYKATDILIESDYSSASFFMLAASICKSKILIHGLNPDSRQGDKKIIEYLNLMGSSCHWRDGNLEVVGNNLTAIKTNMKDTPDLVPPMAIAAAFADGTSEFSGVGHLQFKECNRLKAIIIELTKMGIKSYFQNDSLFVEGNKNQITSSEVETYNDHRIAMSFAVAGLVTGDQNIMNPKCVSKSFPDFWEKFRIFS
jgi:3-phosphoshikimate 1-carboxyvinyltransferase